MLKIKYPSTYPEMEVERREGKSHGLKTPTPQTSPYYKEQLQDTIELCVSERDNDWEDRVLNILLKYAPVKVTKEELILVMNNLGFSSWKEICDFVRDDELIEFMVRVSKYCKSHKLKCKRNEDFIKGKGLGIYTRYLDNLERAAQQAFNEKYLHKVERPLAYLYRTTGLDLSCIAGITHVGHFSYPAFHGVSFYKAVDCANNEWELGNHKRLLIVGAYVAAMGRSGILVHYPEDNLAGGYIADLPEFNNWKQSEK